MGHTGREHDEGEGWESEVHGAAAAEP
jgi:hypothetical protein